MCGIAGIYSFSGPVNENQTKNAIAAMKLRGPDGNGIFLHQQVCLGHARLAIIDTSEAAAQPFTDSSGRYTIVFNGEFFNFQPYREELIKQGVQFKSTGDTEVLLQLYIRYGEKALDRLNGFFAMAIYDKEEESLFLARDRMGIKPLLIYSDENKLIFASEMKALLAYSIPGELNETALFTYLQLNYIPAPYTIFKNVVKLSPGTWVKITRGKIEKKTWYSLPSPEPTQGIKYEDAKNELVRLLEDAVRLRLISDVPLGAFLSGGIDSSAIVALATRHTSKLNTFSIGYKDEPFFDETHYANLVAKKFKTNHTVFSLSNRDLFTDFYNFLESIDEPFADSSALAVYILSRHTRQKATVALSGDGADELFGGYHKHMAHYKILHPGIKEKLVSSSAPLWQVLPKSRNSKAGNIVRQLHRFAQGSNLSHDQRYWLWCSLASATEARKLLKLPFSEDEFSFLQHEITSPLRDFHGLGAVLYADQKLVLQSDMLTKVDLMSMANSLEVRTPFLDYRIIEYAAHLPDEFKVDGRMKKKIVQDAFREILPAELYNRPKHGFEVPLLKWMRNELFNLIDQDLLNKNFIISQGIFNPDETEKLKKQLFSKNPEEVQGRIWAIMVFQYWWKKTLG